MMTKLPPFGTESIPLNTQGKFRENVFCSSSVAAAMALLGLVGNAAHADQWNGSTLHKLQQQFKSKVKIEFNPFTNQSGLTLSTNSGFHLKSLSDRHIVLKLMQQNNTHPFISLVEVAKPYRLGNHAPQTSTFVPAIDGIPFCDHEIKVFHSSASHGSELSIHGLMPEIEGADIASLDTWPSLTSIVSNLEDKLSDKIHQVVEGSRCLVVEDGIAQSARIIDFISSEIPYQAVVSSQTIHRLQVNVLHATGTFRAYRHNPVHAEIIVKEIPNLLGLGNMSSDDFISSPRGREAAYSSEHRFVYPTQDQRFAEASAFLHATHVHRWFADLGFEDGLDQAIQIQVHSKTRSGDPNNAEYEWERENRPPSILIGDGDGVFLQNIALDSDVMTHEYSHHVIYRTLKLMNDQGRVMHEGLADFFSFVRSGDPCLAESICPADSPLCAVKGQCLRTAENDFKYGSSNLPNLYHNRSQFISGMLWDLHRYELMDLETIGKTTLGALGFLLSDSGYRDLVLGLLLADRQLNDGAYGCDIYDVAIERGLGPLIDDISCQDDVNRYAFSKPLEPKYKAPNHDAPSDAPRPVCGVIAHPSASGSRMQGWVVLLMVLWPMGLIYAIQVLRPSQGG